MRIQSSIAISLSHPYWFFSHGPTQSLLQLNPATRCEQRKATISVQYQDKYGRMPATTNGGFLPYNNRIGVPEIIYEGEHILKFPRQALYLRILPKNWDRCLGKSKNIFRHFASVCTQAITNYTVVDYLAS
jgi:hypothetical protein